MPVKRELKGNLTADTVAITYDGIQVATLTRYMNEACETEYVYVVDWKVWDSLGLFYNIPGLNMDLRLPEYVRHSTPVFITEYMASPKREDMVELIKQMGLPNDTDIWELMIATGRPCRDKFRVHRI